MIAQLSNKDSIFSGPVNDAVLVINAPGPVAGKTVLERFRFAAACEGIAHYLMNKGIDAFEHFFVGFLPVEIVLPGIPGKGQFHSASLRLLPPPRSSSAIDSRRRLAFFGTRKRYAVSSSARKSSRDSITTDSFFCLVMMTGSWSSHTFFIVAASLVRAAEYVIVAINISFLHCTYYCTNKGAICQSIKRVIGYKRNSPGIHRSKATSLDSGSTHCRNDGLNKRLYPKLFPALRYRADG